MKTKDFKNPLIRQKFLRDSVNRNLLLAKLSHAREEAERNGLSSEAEMIGKMIAFLEKGSEVDYKDLRRAFRFRKLNLI